MANKKETALDKFSSGYNCAQAVLYSFKDDVYIEGNTALKIACGFGAGMGNGSEIGLQFLLGHADAAVRDRDDFFLVIDRDIDLQRGIGIKNLLFEQLLMAEFFQGIGRIGNQLPQKDLPLGVERVDDDIE